MSFILKICVYVMICSSPHGSVPAVGTLKNFNTIEEFKAADKTALFNHEAQIVRLLYRSNPDYELKATYGHRFGIPSLARVMSLNSTVSF